MEKTRKVFYVWVLRGVWKAINSDAGGWIVTATKKYFCHDGKDGSCFDNYCEQQKLRSEDATYEKEK